jgi:hypothetical protein
LSKGLKNQVREKKRLSPANAAPVIPANIFMLYIVCEIQCLLALPSVAAKEVSMGQSTSIADIVVHLHPESTGENRARIEEELRSHDGVVSVHFSEPDHPHAVVVAYNTAAITSDAILADIRKCDKHAVMAGL